MRIRILGAHNFESRDTRLVSLLVDNILAIDAGGLASSLTFSGQEQIRSILLTHGHYDHLRDIPALALYRFYRATIKVYGLEETLEVLSSHLIDGLIYPKFTERPSKENPTLRLFPLEPYKHFLVENYQVLPLPVRHSVPTVGYLVSKDERSFFYSGDTGPGVASCWDHISPQLLLLDVTLPNRFAFQAEEAGHLTPSLAGQELKKFRELKGYLPKLTFIHLSPPFESQIRREAEELARELGADIELAFEGMELEV